MNDGFYFMTGVISLGNVLDDYRIVLDAGHVIYVGSGAPNYIGDQLEHEVESNALHPIRTGRFHCISDDQRDVISLSFLG